MRFQAPAEPMDSPDQAGSAPSPWKNVADADSLRFEPPVEQTAPAEPEPLPPSEGAVRFTSAEAPRSPAKPPEADGTLRFTSPPADAAMSHSSGDGVRFSAHGEGVPKPTPVKDAVRFSGFPTPENAVKTEPMPPPKTAPATPPPPQPGPIPRNRRPEQRGKGRGGLAEMLRNLMSDD